MCPCPLCFLLWAIIIIVLYRAIKHKKMPTKEDFKAVYKEIKCKWKNSKSSSKQ